MVAEIHAVTPDGEEHVDYFEPEVASIVRLKTKPPEREKRIVVFYVDDVPYSIPAKPGAEIGLAYLKMVKERGQEAGIAYMLETMLGEDGYDALMNYKGLEIEDLSKVVQKIREVTMGALELPKGRQRRG